MAVRVDPREDYRDTIPAGQERVLVVPTQPAAPARRSRRGRDTALAYTILTPTFAVILGMVAYPFFMGIYLSLQSKMVGAPGRFVGLQNYVELFRNDLFLRTVYNSFVYTIVAVAIKFVLGLTMALVLDQERRRLRAELDLASTTRDQLTAVVPVYKALGGGWAVPSGTE